MANWFIIMRIYRLNTLWVVSLYHRAPARYTGRAHLQPPKIARYIRHCVQRPHQKLFIAALTTTESAVDRIEADATEWYYTDSRWYMHVCRLNSPVAARR
jgi:hypothetical protein